MGAARCTVKTHVVGADNPARALLEAADQFGATAIVVGPHSSIRNRWTIGSVTRKLLQHSSVPVIVAKDDGTRTDGTRAANSIRRVVGCVGYGDATETAAMWAADYAAERAVPLTLLHVVGYRPIFPADSPSEMFASYLGPDVVKKWAAEDLDEIRAKVALRQPDVALDAALDVGSAVPAILNAGARAELVVLGKRHMSTTLRALISPRIHRLIVNSKATIAVVPSCSID